MRIVYFDTETTGVKPGKDQIIELALLVYENGELIRESDEFVKIDKKLPSKITKLTGITDEILETKGVPDWAIASILYDNLNPGDVWVAHNAQFDLLFIYNHLVKHYPEEEIQKKLSEIYWLDTLTIFKDRSGYPHKLEDMVKHYEIDEVNFHRAIDDAWALKESLAMLKNERNDIKEYVNIFGYNPRYGVTGEKFDFITYLKQPYFNGLKSYRNILPKTIKEEEE